MNKYLGLLIFAVALFTSGFIYQTYYRPKDIGAITPSGKTVQIEMRVLKDQWKWVPDTIHIGAGDKVVLGIYNEDSYDHGFAIDVFGVNRRLFPQTTTIVEFTPSLSGKFNFYCSVPCGDGHYDQIGTIIVGREHGMMRLVHNTNAILACETMRHLRNDNLSTLGNLSNLSDL